MFLNIFSFKKLPKLPARRRTQGAAQDRVIKTGVASRDAGGEKIIQFHIFFLASWLSQGGFGFSNPFMGGEGLVSQGGGYL